METKIRICLLAELPEEELPVVEAALKATEQSYAPYSKFHVGAAALLEDGTIVTAATRRMPLTLPACVRSGWRCFMPDIGILMSPLSRLPSLPPQMGGRSGAFPLAERAARFCWRRNNATANR